jgi:hypothetical protein
LAALRVRNRIFDVLRFGTPMAGQPARKHISEKKQMVGGDSFTKVTMLQG